MNRRQDLVVSLFSILIALGVPVASQAAPKGNSTPGEIKDCGVIGAPGAYQVVNDLPGPAGLLAGGNCLEIQADSVALNLNSHSITGTGMGAGISDGGASLSNLLVRNGAIAGFDTAVDLSASTASVVEYIQATSNAADGIALGELGVARFNVAIDNDRGLVLTCPANFLGNSAWNNATDLFLIDQQLCNAAENLNSFGSSDGSGASCTSLGFEDCSGNCVDTSTDESHCGSCDTACAAGEVCTSGVCVLNCQAGLSDCSGTCTDTSGDESNCGGCGVACAAGELCIAGACALNCQSGLDECGGVCTDLQTDVNHCGSCGNPCADSEVCTAGVCVASAFCGDGNVDSGEVCDDGNNADGDGCSANCLSDETCGNGIVDSAAGETCDDGNTSNGDGCSDTCQVELVGDCFSDSDCSVAEYCDANTCVPKQSNGAVCSDGIECVSGNCADGRCCNTSCSGQCDSCSLGGSAGTCSLLPDGNPGSPSCSPYLCGGSSSACQNSCVTDLDCASGNFCNGGLCEAKQPLGAACVGDGACQSGFCADGYCCNSSCGGSCQSCGLGGSQGTCTLVPDGQQGDPTCNAYVCSGSSSSCPTICFVDADCASNYYCSGSSCAAKKPNGVSCGSASECASGVCTDGVCSP